MLRILSHILFIIALGLATAWAATALWVHIPQPLLLLLWAGLGAASLAATVLHFQRRRAAWAVIAATALIVGGWYQTLTPSQTRNWAPDVAHGISGEVNGSIVTLHNLRDFAWTSATEATPRWQDLTVNLDDLQSVDMITSTWDSPEIAHLIVSFGFRTGEQIAFSVEIRKELGEEFSTVGGFFRQFELSLIAATEQDIVAVRAQHRGEDVALYPVNLNPEQARVLFLKYLAFGNQLAAKPEFYNTVTANCTTVVYGLVQAIKPDMPLDASLLLSGRLPEYLNDLGGLVGEMPMAQRRANAQISAKAQTLDADQNFSARLRAN